MRSRFKILTGRALLLHLLLLVGVSLAGLHVHHHTGPAHAHVAAGSVCGSNCHETCEAEPTALHVLEILGSALNPDPPEALTAALREQFVLHQDRQSEFLFSGAGAKFFATALRVDWQHPLPTIAISAAPDDSQPLALHRARPDLSRAPPAFAS